MITEIYRSFDGKLDAAHPSGFTISALETGGLRINTQIIYVDAVKYTYYIKPTEAYNADTSFDAANAAMLLELVRADVIKPYRTIKEST